jgi:hypothetical protein
MEDGQAVSGKSIQLKGKPVSDILPFPIFLFIPVFGHCIGIYNWLELYFMPSNIAGCDSMNPAIILVNSKKRTFDILSE